MYALNYIMYSAMPLNFNRWILKIHVTCFIDIRQSNLVAFSKHAHSPSCASVNLWKKFGKCWRHQRCTWRHASHVVAAGGRSPSKVSDFVFQNQTVKSCFNLAPVLTYRPNWTSWMYSSTRSWFWINIENRLSNAVTRKCLINAIHVLHTLSSLNRLRAGRIKSAL